MSLKSNVKFGQTIEEFIDLQLKGTIMFRGKKIKKNDLEKIFSDIDEKILNAKIEVIGVNQIREDIIESIQKKNSKDRAYRT